MSGSNSNNNENESSRQPSREPNTSSTDDRQTISSNINTPPDSRSHSHSLTSRIQSSASGLARNAFFAPGSSSVDLSQALASANGNKGGGPSISSSSGPSGASASASAELQRGSPTLPVAGDQPGAPFAAESFRSTDRITRGQYEGGIGIDEFQHAYGNGENNGGQALLETELGQRRTTEEKGKGKETQQQLEQNNDINNLEPYNSHQPADDSPNFNKAWQQTVSQKKNAAADYTYNPSDGAAVISLLSDQTFDPEFPFDPDTTTHPETNLEPLTKSELEMIDSFRRQLSLPSSTPVTTSQQQNQQQQQHLNLNPSSLIPDINEFLSSIPPQTTTTSDPNIDTTNLRDTVLSNLPGATDWMVVEERYHDEVWGYLRPTLEAAKNEIEARDNRAENGVNRIGNENDGPAVRRLKMVLSHMAG